MLKRNSIFTKIFIPIMIIMLLQVAIINIFLFASGTIDTLNRNAIDILAKNAQNRSMNLEHLMVNYWSNIGGFEQDVIAEINAHLNERGLEITDVLGVHGREIELISDLSPILIDALGVAASTGIFIYLLNGDELSEFELFETTHNLNGLYLRNLSPLSPHRHMGGRGNLMVVRGHVNIARLHGLPLDSLWEEEFTFSPYYEDLWRSFANPQIAAALFPNADTVDISYWTGPHLLNPGSPRDANMQITYTRPLIIDGRLIGIIGTEMQMSHIERSMPARDLDNFSESGFMFVKHERDSLAVDVLSVTGGFMNRLFGGARRLTLTETQTDYVFSVAEHPEVRLVLFPVRVYNLNAPFAHEQWALAAASTESSLFEMSSNVMSVVLLSTATACVVGGVMLFWAIKSFSKPIGSVIKQIQRNDGTAINGHSKTYEIDLLCQTINDMVTRREQTEERILKERQRYLHALASSTDTFMEYSVADDTLSIYFFERKTQQEPSVKTFARFDKVVKSGEFFHPDYLHVADELLYADDATDKEVKVNAAHFTHITDSPADNGYFWFSLKLISIYDADGERAKIIGTAREITREKLEEIADAEKERRDLTTGLYNHAYGLELAGKDGGFALDLVRVNNFDRLEMAYGQIFGGIYIAELSHAVTNVIQEPDFIVRYSANEFLLFNREKHEKNHYGKDIRAAFEKQYAGERTDLELSLQIEAFDGAVSAESEPEHPVTVFLDLADKEKIGELALELFERTLHINSSVKLLIGLIGRLFELDRVIICSYDVNFGTNQVVHQWCSENAEPVSGEIVKLPQTDFEYFKASLDEDGTLVHSDYTNIRSLDVLLCLTPKSVSTYCCSTYENAVDTGRMLFVSAKDKTWNVRERLLLHNLTKIMATYISADKSRSASRAKSMFLSRISHEIRTPMNSIIGMTNIALASEQKPDTVHDCLAKISTSANYLLSLINDVLEMSRVESGRLIQVEEKPFNLNGFVREIEDLMRFAIEERNIQFNIVNNTVNTRVIGDQFRLKQVLINLLGNAYKFTKPGGVITFSINEEESGRFNFSVKDSGIGIPYDKQASVFDPFEQADATPYSGSYSGGQQGTGLGLAITKNILLAMKSKIELNSTPGKGSDFYFSLKLRLDETDEKPQDDEFDYTGYFEGKRVLLVDDVPINIEVAAFVLENAGFNVETAINGQDALNLFFAAPEGYYDIIVMDIQMPVMDGVEATKQLRKSGLPHAKTVPIIAMTANAFDDDLRKYIESGMDGYITKPLQVEEMLGVLRKKVVSD